MKFSRAAEAMITRIAACERDGKMLSFSDVDYRVFPSLMSGGYVASSIYRPGGVCFTPKGRELAKEKGLL